MPQFAVLGSERLDPAPARSEEADPPLHLGVREDLLVEADRLEDPQHLVVEHRRPRQLVRLERLLDGDRAHAEIAEQQREQLADGSEPTDEDVAVAHDGTAVAG